MTKPRYTNTVIPKLHDPEAQCHRLFNYYPSFSFFFFFFFFSCCFSGCFFSEDAEDDSD
jgi:hypothetical protein